MDGWQVALFYGCKYRTLEQAQARTLPTLTPTLTLTPTPTLTLTLIPGGHAA